MTWRPAPGRQAPFETRPRVLETWPQVRCTGGRSQGREQLSSAARARACVRLCGGVRVWWRWCTCVVVCGARLRAQRRRRHSAGSPARTCSCPRSRTCPRCPPPMKPHMPEILSRDTHATARLSDSDYEAAHARGGAASRTRASARSSVCGHVRTTFIFGAPRSWRRSPGTGEHANHHPARLIKRPRVPYLGWYEHSSSAPLRRSRLFSMGCPPGLRPRKRKTSSVGPPCGLKRMHAYFLRRTRVRVARHLRFATRGPPPGVSRALLVFPHPSVSRMRLAISFS